MKLARFGTRSELEANWAGVISSHISKKLAYEDSSLILSLILCSFNLDHNTRNDVIVKQFPFNPCLHKIRPKIWVFIEVQS